MQPYTRNGSIIGVTQDLGGTAPRTKGIWDMTALYDYESSLPPATFGGYIGGETSGSGLTTYNFSPSFTIPSGNKLLVLSCGGNGTAPIVSASINGSSATIVQNSATGYFAVCLAVLETTTTSITSISFTLTGTAQRGRYDISYLTGVSNPTPFDTAIFETSSLSATTTSVNIDCPKNGTLVAAGWLHEETAMTWTGATEIYDVNVFNTYQHSGAYADFTAEELNKSISMTHSSRQRRALLAASWK